MTVSCINKPNFFILGAGRSGSTYLYSLLRQHPDIFLTTPKEPMFWCKQFQIINNPIDYFELYDSVSGEAIIGEASHAYLSTPSTARVLKALFPESKFLVILRNPADRAYSLYHWMRRYGFEHFLTFEEALEAEESRFNSNSFMDDCGQYFYNFMYFRSGLYGEQLGRYFELFPKQQFHIVKFEEFTVNRPSYLREIFQFLEVDQNYSPQFEVERNTGDIAEPFPPRMSPLAMDGTVSVPPPSATTRASLLDRYSSDLHHLSEMTGITFA